MRAGWSSAPYQPDDVRLRLTPLAFLVIRSSDLLALQFRMNGLALQAIAGQIPELVIAQPGQVGTLSVTFPPQHMAEEAYYAIVDGYQLPSDPNPTEPAKSPIAVRLAGETTLAFAVPDDLDPIPLSLDSLLDWSAYTLLPTVPGSAANPLTTSIELPYRLMLSPDAKAGFANTDFASNGQRPGGSLAGQTGDV